MISNPDEYAKFLDSDENPTKFNTPEKSPVLKLLRQLTKEEQDAVDNNEVQNE